jgi:hypothetical protein
MTKVEPRLPARSQRREPVATQGSQSEIEAGAPQEFADVDLRRLRWMSGGSSGEDSYGEWVTTSYADEEVVFQGQPLSLLGSYKRTEPLRGTPSVEYKFLVIGEKSRVTEQLHLQIHDDAISATTDILKEDPNHTLPNGIGRELYRKVLDFLQGLADQHQLPVDHMVTRYPDVSPTPLTVKRWNELFLPILEESGYKALPIVKNGWMKRYEPGAKRSMNRDLTD